MHWPSLSSILDKSCYWMALNSPSSHIVSSLQAASTWVLLQSRNQGTVSVANWILAFSMSYLSFFPIFIPFLPFVASIMLFLILKTQLVLSFKSTGDLAWLTAQEKTKTKCLLALSIACTTLVLGAILRIHWRPHLANQVLFSLEHVLCHCYGMRLPQCGCASHAFRPPLAYIWFGYLIRTRIGTSGGHAQTLYTPVSHQSDVWHRLDSMFSFCACWLYFAFSQNERTGN